MEELPPPADHVLRPHHISILSVLMLAFREMEIKKFPGPFALNLNRVLLNEIAQVAQPKPYEEFMLMIFSCPGVESKRCQEFLVNVKAIRADIENIQKMANFLGNIPCLFMSKNAEDNPRFTRRSIFGFFARRCYLTSTKLSYPGLDRLCKDYAAWSTGDSSAGYQIMRKDELSSDLFVFKTHNDRRNRAKSQYYESWEKARVVGDESLAIENLRRFFEQHFHDGNDSGFRHHALLNLVRMHYTEGEYVAAKKLLLEAINAARTSGDKVALHHCTSLLNRLPTDKEGQKPILNNVQPDIHPLEVLFDVSKLLAEENGQPLNAAFVKIFQAVGVYDHWLDIQCELPGENQEWAQHAVQSIVWREAGCERLANVEEVSVLVSLEEGGDSNTRLSVLLNRAYRTARQGGYDEAIAMLIDPSVWRGLIMHDYTTWAHQIWHILVLRATRRGQLRLYREILLPRRPDGEFNPKEYLFHTSNSEPMSVIRESLYQILQMGQVDQATFGIEHLLHALWNSEFLCRFGLYRTAIVILADISLEFGMSTRAEQILDEVMPQIITGNDIELRAVACFTHARCCIAISKDSPERFREAIPWLEMAEREFRALEMYRSLQDVQYLLSVAFHHMDMREARQAAAQRHAECERLQNELEMDTVTSYAEVLKVFEVIASVGDVLAAR